MTLVTLDKVVRRFGDYAILDGLSLRVDEGDRIGVVGDNGAGKTTMIRILAGVDDADLGQRNTRKDLRIAYGAQMPAMPKGTTVMDLVLRGTGEHEALEQRMRALETRMAAGDEAALTSSPRPTEDLKAALENGVVLISGYGTADDVVPHEDNGQVLVDFWRSSGGEVHVFPNEGGGHFPHGVVDARPMVELLTGEERARGQGE